SSTSLARLSPAPPTTAIIPSRTSPSASGALGLAAPLFTALNVTLGEGTSLNRVRFANPFPIFNTQGALNAEVHAICSLALLCTQNDSHPSDLGYRVLGDLVFQVSGYTRLLE